MDELALRAEGIVYDYEPGWEPSGFELIERADLLMWRTASSRRWSNRVGYARWSAADADRGIDDVFAYFGDSPFTWCVGPSSRPADLGERLERRGLRPRDGRLMTAQLPLRGLRSNPEVRIEEISSPDDADRLVRFVHPDWPEERRQEAIVERRSYLAFPGRLGGFLIAHLGDQPVANAGYRYSTDGTCLYLTGAETREPYRGRGVYSALVAHRVDLGHRRGCRWAIIRALPDTSAPILRKRGFVDRGPLIVYERAVIR